MAKYSSCEESWFSFFCICMETSSLLVLEKMWSGERRLWVRDLAFPHYPSPWAPLLLCRKSNSGPLGYTVNTSLQMQSKSVFHKHWGRSGFLELVVLDFNKSLIELYVQKHWLSCDHRENLSCQTAPCIVTSDTTIGDSRSYGFAFAYYYFNNLFLILAHLRQSSAWLLSEGRILAFATGMVARRKTEMDCAS